MAIRVYQRHNIFKELLLKKILFFNFNVIMSSIRYNVLFIGVLEVDISDDIR